MLTVREIKEILRRERLSISKRRGQNFLVDQRVQKRIIDAVDIKPSDEILEIGPGLGALTAGLLTTQAKARKVIGVEKDKKLAQILKQQLGADNRLEIIYADILKLDLGRFTNQRLKVVGNLPYYISTPIIGYLLEEQRERIREIFITVQDEVGRRMLAKAGNKDYSSFSLLVQYFTKAALLFTIPKRAFYPQPKVDSVFVHLQILEQPRIRVNNQEQFFKVVRACFSQRRKTILNSLAHQLGRIQKHELAEVLREADIDASARPESLSLDEFAKIEHAFWRRRIRFE